VAVFKRVKEALKKVIEVTATTVRRVDVNLDGQRTGKWLHASGGELSTHAFAKQPSLPTDQSSRADPPPVVID
jgi:nitric oxide reductase activation protein